MATTQMSRDEAAALYDRTLRAMHPDKVLQDRMEKLKREIERQLEERFADGLQVPLGVPEAEAIQSVKDQLIRMGVTPTDDDSEIQRIVRQARDG
jgi:hypothetical protein